MYGKRKTTTRSKTPITKRKRPGPTNTTTKVVGSGSKYPNTKYTCVSGLHQLKRGMLGTGLRSKLTYLERRISLNPGIGGTSVSHIFAVNGLYDPNITGVGHQPLGFDQMMLFFANYSVISAKIYVSIHNSDGTHPMLTGVYITDDSTSSPDPIEIIENGNGVYTLLTEHALGNDTANMELYCNTKQFLGKKYDEVDSMGSATANPGQMVYFQVWAATQNAAVDGGNLYATVRIEYLADFLEPQQLAIS